MMTTRRDSQKGSANFEMHACAAAETADAVIVFSENCVADFTATATINDNRKLSKKNKHAQRTGLEFFHLIHYSTILNDNGNDDILCGCFSFRAIREWKTVFMSLSQSKVK